MLLLICYFTTITLWLKARSVHAECGDGRGCQLQAMPGAAVAAVLLTVILTCLLVLLMLVYQLGLVHRRRRGCPPASNPHNRKETEEEEEEGEAAAVAADLTAATIERRPSLRGKRMYRAASPPPPTVLATSVVTDPSLMLQHYQLPQGQSASSLASLTRTRSTRQSTDAGIALPQPVHYRRSTSTAYTGNARSAVSVVSAASLPYTLVIETAVPHSQETTPDSSSNTSSPSTSSSGEQPLAIRTREPPIPLPRLPSTWFDRTPASALPVSVLVGRVSSPGMGGTEGIRHPAAHENRRRAERQTGSRRPKLARPVMIP